jgi:uncharacterized protein (DUF608 family)
MRLVLVLPAAVLLAGFSAGAAEPLRLSEVKWDFETGGLEGWTVVSGNLGKQPSSNDNDRWQGNFGKHGKYFIGTYEDGGKALGDQVTGEIRSPVFVVDADAVALLVGGGNDLQRTYVALCDADGDKELLKASGKMAEAMEDVVWDVSKFVGKRCYLKVVDKAAGGWGHINVDCVRPVTKEELARIEKQRQEAAERARKAEQDMRDKWAAINEEYLKHVLDPMPRKTYSGKALAACQMPLGGIGAGTIYLGGDCYFRRWMIHDARSAQVPDAFFAVRTKVGDKVVARMLRTGENGVKDIRFVGEFPIALHWFEDDALPVRVSMETFSPFVPLDEQASSLPALLFFIMVRNPGTEPVEVSVVGSLQNAVGRDPGKNTPGVENPGYGGNVCGPLASDHWASVEMTQNGKPGSMVLAAADVGDEAQGLEPWTDAKDFWAALAAGGLKPAAAPSEPSAPGKTWNGAVRVTCTLRPGVVQIFPFLWSWHLPGGPRGSHAYESRFAGAAEVCKYLDANVQRLAGDTRLFHDAFFASTLPWYVLDRVSSQCSTLATGVVHWTKEGNVYGWEGLNCCHGGCTHVWNYEQTLAYLFPALERKMREMNLGVGMQSDGGVYNRLGRPDAPWGDGNEGPAADGHASTLSKTYREWRLSADDAWLKARYPAVKKAMEYWIQRWDGPEEDGVARGRQFNTYDTEVVGPNTFVGSQYMAALRAAEEMAKVAGDEASAARWRGIFEKSSAAYARECWDEELKYFVQRIPEGQRAADYGNACFVDQVLGQWWALVNDLGYVLPKEKVDASLAAIWKWNMVGDISLYKYHYERPRIFIWDKGKGLMICTWPRGDYLKGPILYREEVWTGCEYHAAASMIWEGMAREGLAVVKAVHERYTDGVRNPWNEIECGDHYARAMSSWSVLLACQGGSYVGPRGKVGFDPRVMPDDHKSFFSGAEGWGTFVQKRGAAAQTNEISLKWGRLRLAELALGIPPGTAAAKASVELGQARPQVEPTVKGGKVILKFQPAVNLEAGQSLRVVTTW